MKISEIITDKYKLRIPPTVYYDLLADVREVEEEQEPTTKNNLSSELEKNSKKLDCNICDSCHTKGCIFQSGIKRVNCEFYTAQNEPCNDAISRESLLNKLCGYHVDIEKSIFDKLWRVIKDMPSVTPQLSSELEKNSKKLEKDFGELDCISRSDAIRIASGYCHPSNVSKELAKLPSVTPQPRKGHWIRISPAEIYECSECGQNVMTSDICVYKFCHGCGTKMVEPQKSEDNK